MARVGEPLVSIAGGGAPSSFLQPGALRLRPGDRPVWVDLQLSTTDARRWRERAATYRLPSDVWLGLLVEYEIVCSHLRQVGGDELVSTVLACAERAVAAPRLAPTPELRRWLDQLDGAEPVDALPSIVIAARLFAQLPHDDRTDAIFAAAQSGNERQALVLDRAAARCGQTPEAWAYLAAASA
jgi:transposase InsO family protein